MATYTPNLNLKKPSTGEKYDVVADLNDAKDKIDLAVGNNTTDLTKKAPIMTFLKLNPLVNIIDTSAFTSDNYHDLYNTLTTDSRFTRETLGKDQSGLYNILMYKYEPTAYKSTLMVVCSLHGVEHYGAYIMYKLFELLLNDSKLPPQLESLRNSRILCIPCANPWGINQVSADHDTRRGNSRGVDLNRNFDYNWATSTGGFGLSKGATAFSENETKNIKYVLERYNVSHFLDVHGFPNPSSYANDYLFWGNVKAEANTNQLIKWLNQTYPGLIVEHNTAENDSTSNNYANRVRNIPSMNIEIIQNRFGSADVTRWTELLLNFLLLQSQSRFNANYQTNIAKFVETAYQTDEVANYFTVPTLWTPIPSLEKQMTIDTDGLAIASGWITIKVIGDVTITISPYIEQKGFRNVVIPSERNRQYIKVSTGTYTMPFHVLFPARKGIETADFHCDIIKEGTGTAEVQRKNLTQVFIPTDFSVRTLPQHTNTANNDLPV